VSYLGGGRLEPGGIGRRCSGAVGRPGAQGAVAALEGGGGGGVAPTAAAPQPAPAGPARSGRVGARPTGA